jgi:hypothetical protein
MTRPVVGEVAEEMYRRMGPVTDQDEVLGWPLLTYVGAFCDTYLQDIDDLSSDQPTYGGWGGIMNPDTAPLYALPWTAQFVGVRYNSALSQADNIALIKEPTGWKRGSPQAIIAAIKPFLTGSKSVVLTERYTGDAYKVLVTTQTGECPNVPAMQAAALAQKPAGILMTFSAVLGQLYSQLKTAQATYAAAKAAYVNYTAMRNG